MKKRPGKKEAAKIAAWNKLSLRKQLNQISEKQDWRAPNFDNLDQQWSDEDYTQDWANEMHRRDPSIQICEIRSNPNDPPDCFAKMNGKCVAVEVGKLVGEHRDADWPLEKFKESLQQMVKQKDTGRDRSLHKQFLLIPVGTETLLGESVLKEYLKKIKVPRPNSFDAVYVMGSHVPNDGDSGLRRVSRPDSNCYKYDEVGPNLAEGHYPVFEVCLSDSHHQ